MAGSEDSGWQKHAPPEIITLLLHKLQPKKYGAAQKYHNSPGAAEACSHGYSSPSCSQVKTTQHDRTQHKGTRHATPRHATCDTWNNSSCAGGERGPCVRAATLGKKREELMAPLFLCIPSTDFGAITVQIEGRVLWALVYISVLSSFPDSG